MMATLEELFLVDAPDTGYPHGRQDDGWVPVTEEVPQDGQLYARSYLRWLPVPDAGGGISDVPPYPPVIWGRTTGRWVELPSATGIISEPLPPANPAPDTMWFNTETGKTYIYYTDSPSGAAVWVQIS
jgi:hypothetical protein